MDVFQRLKIDEQRVRVELDKLDWSGPMTAAEIAGQLRSLPDDLLADVPAGAIFHEPDEVIRAIRGEIDLDEEDFPADGAASIGGPAGYGESPTGRMAPARPQGGGVGSGTDTGDTGSGNTEATGWGRPGTTFGEEAVEYDTEEELSGEDPR
jgi:hypothetical protein